MSVFSSKLQVLLSVFNRFNIDRSESAVKQSGLVLLCLLGFISPIILMLIGQGNQVGPIVTLFVVFTSISTYILYILYSGRLMAGLLAAVPVLLLFDISLPLSPTIETRQVRFLLAGSVALPLVILYLNSTEIKIHPPVKMILLLLLLFSTSSILSGVISYIKGYPMTGVVFGLNTLNILLILFGVALAMNEFDSKSIIDLLLYSSSLHVSWAILQSLIGKSFGLPYLGDQEGGIIFRDELQLLIFDIPLGVFSVGRFAGGFAGNSRILMGILLILCPVAIYRFMRCRSTPLIALFTIISSVFMIGLAHTDSGFGAFVIGIVLAVYVNSKFEIKGIRRVHFYSGVIAGIITTIYITWIVFKNSSLSGVAPRFNQYTTALGAWNENLLFGIGGYNSIILLSVEYDIHSFLIAFMTELGIVTTSLYILSIAIPFIIFTNVYFSNNNYNRYIAGIIISIIISFHFYISLTTIYMTWNVMTLFWLVILLGLYDNI